MKKLKGSITIEASIVMSITIFIIFSFTILTLWLRDRVVVTAVLQEALEMGRQQDSEEIQDWLAAELDVLFAAEGRLTEVDFDEDKAGIGWSSESTSLYPGGELLFAEKIERRYYDPPSFLRTCRIAERLVENIDN